MYYRNIQGSLTGQPYQGIAIASFGGVVPGGAGTDSHSGLGLAPSHLIVTNSTFEQIGRIGIIVKGTQSTAEISGNTYTGKGIGDFLDYAFEVGAGGSATISGNTISGNRGVVIDGNGPGENSTSAGILVTDFFGTGTSATITGNTISDSTDAIAAGFLVVDVSVVTAHNNSFAGNDVGVNSTNPTVNATNNWWGNSSGPTHASNPAGTGVTVSDNVNFNPWYVDEGMATLSNIPFSLTLNGDEYMIVFTSNGFTDPGVTATGPLVEVEVEGSVDDDTPGIYTLTYTATDALGNTVFVTRRVEVKQTSAGSGGRGRSAGAASPQALQAITNAGVTLPPSAAPVIGQVLGAFTEVERQAQIATVRTSLVSLINQMIGLLQAQLAAAIQAQGN